MTYEFTTLGAIIGLAIAIIMIIKKIHPAYSLIAGALIGGIIGGGGLSTTVNTMITGAQGMMSSVLRILTSGILAGMLIKTGSAEKIADVIVQKLGQKRAIAAIAGPVVVVCLLALRPLLGISVDPLIALPHGSFFHATGGSVNMTIKERLAVIPYEACVGLTSTIVSVLIYLI